MRMLSAYCCYMPNILIFYLIYYVSVNPLFGKNLGSNFRLLKIFHIIHSFHRESLCVKSVRVRSYSSLYFPAFGLNAERYFVYTDQNNSEYGHFSRSVWWIWWYKVILEAYSEPCQTSKMELFVKIINGLNNNEETFSVNDNCRQPHSRSLIFFSLFT